MKTTQPRALSAQNPWPGPSTYEEASSDFFFGRETESEELLRLLSLSHLVALYGKSGLGKSSLLLAGLFPRLRKQSALPVWVRLDFSTRARPVSDQIASRLDAELKAVGASCEPRRSGESLWQFLHRDELRIWLPGLQPASLVFVLDQLEEMFTLGSRDKARQQQALAELTSLFENLEPPAPDGVGRSPAAGRLDAEAHRYRVLVAFREDFLPDFKGFSARVPSLLQRELRLLPMTRETAIRAVRQAGVAVLAKDNLDAASAIVDFVGNAEGGGSASGEIEPALLSLCCYRLVQRLGGKRIDRAMVEASAPNIFEKYYLEAVADMPRAAAFIEDHLIVGERFRGSYPLQQALDDGLLSRPQLARLTDEFRLLRIDPHGDTPRIELIHDRMVAPVRAARDARRQQLARGSGGREQPAHLSEVESQRAQNANAITFRLAGQIDNTTGSDPLPWLADGVRRSVRLSAPAAPGQASVQLTALPGQDVVVLRLRNGPTLVLHPETALDLLSGEQRIDRGSRHAATVFDVRDNRLGWHGSMAGAEGTQGAAGDAMLVALEVFTGSERSEPGDPAAIESVARVDRLVEAGVYPLRRDAFIKLTGGGEPMLPACDEPILLFVHGSFLDTASTFGALWSLHPHRVRELFDNYGDRVYAFDHPTLGTGPIANAISLVERLPAGARLHLITHSRGGLVAELLARVAARPLLTPDDLAFFFGAADAGQSAELVRLAERIAERRIKVERVVRVACPARGTLLASRRLDVYLSVLAWALDLVGVPLAPELTALLVELARHRTDPRLLPGLAAMLPDSPLVQWLNGSGEALPGELRVIAGDLYGDAAGRWSKTLLADTLSWTNSDVVVQTRSMYGGAPRAGGASFLLDRGDLVSHFSYFTNARTVDAVVAALLQDKPAGFRPIGALSWAAADASRVPATRPLMAAGAVAIKPAVFVLPDLFGSHLAVRGRRIWLGPRLIGGMDRLGWEGGAADGIAADGPVGLLYSKLMEHLARTHEVIPFTFDWRCPIEDEARRLADAVNAALDARGTTGQPVRLLAHGMGGLVARAMQLERPEVWQRFMAHDDARFVMLGTPNAGSWTPMQLLSCDDPLNDALAACGRPMNDRAVRQVLATMPGLLQLQAGLLDDDLKLGNASTWRKLAGADLATLREAHWWHSDEAQLLAFAWGVPPQDVLDRAVALRRRLDRQSEEVLPSFANRMCLVVGHARFTPNGFSSNDAGLAYVDAVDCGDGRVTHASAMLPGVPTWLLDKEHQALPASREAFLAFEELLTRGDTAHLTRLTEDLHEEPSATIWRVRSSRGPLTGAAAPGGEYALLQVTDRWYESSGSTPPGAALRVVVQNCNLAFVRGPVMLGHCRSQALALTGTERVVDVLLGGAMTAALDAGLYPDTPGTHQFYANRRRDPMNPWRSPQPEAVIVVGLGEEGRLRAPDLVDSVCRGVIAWSQRLAESGGGSPVTFELSATLMGSAAGLSAGAAARAIALGVREANDRLAVRGCPEVDRLQLVDLYLERCSEAIADLQVQAEITPGFFKIEPTIHFGPGALRRPLGHVYRGTDHDLIKATTTEPDVISFTLDTHRRSAEVRAVTRQGKLVRELVSHASQDARNDPQIGRTLFQMLVPQEVESFLGGTARMVLEVDAGTAGIPWELLDLPAERRAGGDPRPWSIRTALLRRMLTYEFRTRLRDSSLGDDILVLGEPRTDTRFARLPGARVEAKAVAATLRAVGGVAAARVVELTRDEDATTIVNTLMSRNWRILHVAGHGAPGPTGGVVLSDGVFLGLREIASLRTVPELVFINCCHLAEREPDLVRETFDRTSFAAGMAEGLIALGVRCVVVAGWVVEDEPARVFATTLYRELLVGRPFIGAVAQAREACWAEGGNTWGAYQCYGDPYWIFRYTAHDAYKTLRGSPLDEFTGITSPIDLAHTLETLVVRSQFGGTWTAVQVEKIRHLEGRFAALWGGMGAVAEAFGMAYAAANAIDSAVDWYARAVACNDGSASMKASEQLGKLRVISAGRLLGEGIDPARLAEARREIDIAIRDLGTLAQLHPTTERHCLCGAAWRRRALVDRRAGDLAATANAVGRMSESYRAAENLATVTQDPNLHYAVLNRMAAELVANSANPSWEGFDIRAVDSARRALQTRAASEPDFWSLVGLIELEVYVALACRELPSTLGALFEGFEELHLRVANRWMWASVAEHVGFFVLSAFEDRQDPAVAAAARSLRIRLESYGA
jgi:CHAT domain/Lecithin:cholesterol acyltransferase